MTALKRHRLEKMPVSQLCDELGIPKIYRCLKEFYSRKAQSVEQSKGHKIEQLKAKLQRKNDVLAELVEEHIQLKKDLGNSERR